MKRKRKKIISIKSVGDACDNGMVRGLWRKSEILPIILAMMYSVTCLSIGTASINLTIRRNQSAEVGQNFLKPTDNRDTLEANLIPNNDEQLRKTRARKLRYRRNVMQMARMLKCMSGCNPLSYRGYGCFCGYMGSGQPVDDIDRCCLQHDWCYSFISCPQTLIYFVPYTWQCMNPGAAHCGIASVPGVSQKCATQLCECDREFARCVSNYPCPRKKPGCKANNYVMFQTLSNNDV